MKIWRAIRRLFEPIPYPPLPEGADFETMLEWQASNPNLHLCIRSAAAKTLAQTTERRARIEEIKEVVREELHHQRLRHPQQAGRAE